MRMRMTLQCQAESPMDTARAKAAGFTQELYFENNSLVNLHSGKKYTPKECEVILHERLSDSINATKIFWIKCVDGITGYIRSTNETCSKKLYKFLVEEK